MSRNGLSYGQEKNVIELSNIVECLDKHFKGDGSDNEHVTKAHAFYREELFKAIAKLNKTNEGDG